MQHAACRMHTKKGTARRFYSQSKSAHSLKNITELVFMFITSAKARFNVENFHNEFEIHWPNEKCEREREIATLQNQISL